MARSFGPGSLDRHNSGRLTLMDESAFRPNDAGLHWAVSALFDDFVDVNMSELPDALPDEGMGPKDALAMLAPSILGQGRDLSAAGFFAHMDPPTPWVTWAASLWTASKNQNLLHPDTAPQAREMEQRVIGWLAPYFGQSGGHFTPGSTVANVTAIWAAREIGAQSVVAGAGAHLSVRKAAHLLNMPFRVVENWSDPGDVSASVVVLTAGTTSTGEIEPLAAAPDALWRHADAAWSGPLRLSQQHSHLLDGIDDFDSVAVSAHKWLFQPKESALILFADHQSAHESISVDGAYLAVPNVGVLGSHGAAAAPLLATLLAYGRNGIAQMLDQSMELADWLHDLAEASDDFVVRSRPHTGVLCWRHRTVAPDAIKQHLTDDAFISTTTVDGEPWLRSVAANPLANPEYVFQAARQAAEAATTGNQATP
jgi:L-2,4-diaminobutyrate decarboxylase